MKSTFPYPVSVAPMMECTDRHFRFLFRQISRKSLLYTEMIHARAIVHGDHERLLQYQAVEHPIAIQIGGSAPELLAEAAKIAVDTYGYDEVNLNVGCPSARVQDGAFGACMMRTPEIVADAVTAMQEAVDAEITVKHRIGVDDLDRYEDMRNFVDIVSKTGCKRFSVHARKAWLSGLNPRQNRNIPPLRYDDVYRLKAELPDLDIEINGGIKTGQEVHEHLSHVDAVMIGRAAYDNPWLFRDFDTQFFGADSNPSASRHEAVEKTFDYIENELESGTRLSHMTRHMFSLFNGLPGARSYRRFLGQNSFAKGAGLEVLQEALTLVPREASESAVTPGLDEALRPEQVGR